MAPPALRGGFPSRSRPVLARVTISAARGRGGDGTVRSDGRLDRASLVTVLDDVDLSAGGMDADPEARDVVIPHDPFAFRRRERVDRSLGDFGHDGDLLAFRITDRLGTYRERFRVYCKPFMAGAKQHNISNNNVFIHSCRLMPQL